ncbi:MAG: carbamoyltransferase HypF, partial [Candidatus Neomarinimicrobiota bacterium]
AAYDFEIETGSDRFVIVWQKMIGEVLEDLERSTGLDRIAGKFHDGLANILLQAALIARQVTGIATVALSGGVFMNIRLLTSLNRLLNEQGFTVYTHHLTPCNDGGIAFGQAVIANAIYQSQNHLTSS